MENNNIDKIELYTFVAISTYYEFLDDLSDFILKFLLLFFFKFNFSSF